MLMDRIDVSEFRNLSMAKAGELADLRRIDPIAAAPATGDLGLTSTALDDVHPQGQAAPKRRRCHSSWSRACSEGFMSEGNSFGTCTGHVGFSQ
jgi:hypothetical protein